jgi:hypothetical protein
VAIAINLPVRLESLAQIRVELWSPPVRYSRVLRRSCKVPSAQATAELRPDRPLGPRRAHRSLWASGLAGEQHGAGVWASRAQYAVYSWKDAATAMPPGPPDSESGSSASPPGRSPDETKSVSSSDTRMRRRASQGTLRGPSGSSAPQFSSHQSSQALSGNHGALSAAARHGYESRLCRDPVDVIDEA